MISVSRRDVIMGRGGHSLFSLDSRDACCIQLARHSSGRRASVGRPSERACARRMGLSIDN